MAISFCLGLTSEISLRYLKMQLSGQVASGGIFCGILTQSGSYSLTFAEKYVEIAELWPFLFA